MVSTTTSPADSRSQRPSMIGLSASFRDVFDRIERVASTEANVLLAGESGTGKGLAAQTIHDKSPRRTGPFVPVDCGALPGELLESELFGHRRGAFTGAEAARSGRFASAHKGTLFLDGIDLLPLRAQSRILRAVQEREIVPLGASAPLRIDFRLVSAVTEEFAHRLEGGRFRHDLYHRLNVVRLELPALRQRPEDLEPLVRAFLSDVCARFGKSCARFDRAAWQALRAYDWPGNVRELRSVVECAAATARGEVIRESDLPVFVRQRAAGAAGSQTATPTATPTTTPDGSQPPPESGTFHQRVEAFQRRLLAETLGACGWSYERCGEKLGLSRHQVKYLCAKLGIRRSLFQP